MNERPSRRRLIRSATGVSAALVAGCLGSDDEGDADVNAPVLLFNRTDTDHEVTIVIHNQTMDERMIDETVSISGGDDDRLEFTAEGDDDERPFAWAKAVLESVEDAETPSTYEGPGAETAEWHEKYEDNRHVATEAGTLGPNGIGHFDLSISESGGDFETFTDVRLTSGGV